MRVHGSKADYKGIAACITASARLLNAITFAMFVLRGMGSQWLTILKGVLDAVSP